MITWRFDYDGVIDGIAEPPLIILSDADGDIARLFIDPEPTVENPQCEDSHWKLPALAEKIIHALEREFAA